MTSGALAPDYPTVACNVGGEMQAHVSDLASNPAPLVLTYRAPATAATITNSASATCSGGCMPAPTSTGVGDRRRADDHRDEDGSGHGAPGRQPALDDH